MSLGRYRLPTIPYEAPNSPSLYDVWESDTIHNFPPPLSVRDSSYRALIISVIQALDTSRRALIGIGSGNGLVEAELHELGWDVLATDCLDSAVRSCRDKGLRAQRFCLLEDETIGEFDVIYCDGVLGHLWQPRVNCVPAWNAMAQLGHIGSLAVISNDLADDDSAATFTVHDSADARFYRPTSGSLAADANATGKWELESATVYGYDRRGLTRRREILTMRLLVDNGIEAQDLS